MEFFSKRYTKDEFGCHEWTRKQKYMMGISEEMNNKESKIYSLWVKEVKAAKEYFGEEMVKNCWHAAEPVKSNLSEQIKKAKEIENKVDL